MKKLLALGLVALLAVPALGACTTKLAIVDVQAGTSPTPAYFRLTEGETSAEVIAEVFERRMTVMQRELDEQAAAEAQAAAAEQAAAAQAAAEQAAAEAAAAEAAGEGDWGYVDAGQSAAPTSGGLAQDDPNCLDGVVIN
jgi:hypothetical protein